MKRNKDKLAQWTRDLRVRLADECAHTSLVLQRNKLDPDLSAMDIALRLASEYKPKELADMLAVSLIVHTVEVETGH